MPNVRFELSGASGRIRVRPPRSDDEDVDEDDMDDDEDNGSEESRIEEHRQQREYDRMRIQQAEAARYAKRHQRMTTPQVPLNPYAAPQPQYVSVEAITNLMDARFNRLEGMLQMALVGIFLSVIVVIVLATLLLK